VFTFEMHYMIYKNHLKILSVGIFVALTVAALYISSGSVKEAVAQNNMTNETIISEDMMGNETLGNQTQTKDMQLQGLMNQTALGK
jgi:hypothetical protein